MELEASPGIVHVADRGFFTQLPPDLTVAMETLNGDGCGDFKWAGDQWRMGAVAKTAQSKEVRCARETNSSISVSTTESSACWNQAQ